MWYEFIIYNPIAWVAILIFGGSFLSWLYWWCKANVVLRGSWKKLDKSVHWEQRKHNRAFSLRNRRNK